MASFSFSFAVAFLLSNKINLSRFNVSSGIAAFAFGSIFSLGTATAPLLFLLSFFTGKASALFGTGTFIALAFGVGRGFPFLLAGIFSGALAWMINLRRWQKMLQRGASFSLIVAGIYFLSLYFNLN